MTTETKPTRKPRARPKTIIQEALEEAAAVREACGDIHNDKTAAEFWKGLEVPNTAREEDRAESVRKRWMR